MNYQELIEKINNYNYHYYDLSESIVSDEEYDSLYDALVSYEKSQGWKDNNSPTLRVGNDKGKVKHYCKLYSLNKVYNSEEINDNFIISTPKIDGANLCVIYKKGKLHLALTRGNGEYGDDVTYLATNITNMPSNIPLNEDVVVVGECVTDNDVTNFRNYVSGALGLKNTEEFKSRNIVFIAHDWLQVEKDYTDRMNMLEEFGFSTVLNVSDKYPTDGTVYRVNDYSKEKLLGYTSKYPKFAVALKKRETETAVSTIQEIIWSIGRTGAVTPVAVIDEVILEEAKINRVTLHNYGMVVSHNLKPGDTIEIERAGSVIPKFIKKIVDNNHSYKITKELVEKEIGCETRLENNIRLVTVDRDKNHDIKQLEYFIKIMGIKHLGPASLEKTKLSSIPDLYTYKDWKLLGANGEKIKEQIEISKTKPYHVVLASLGIPGVGLSTSKLIVKEIPKFENLAEIQNANIKNVGAKTKENVLNWLPTNQEWVYTLPVSLEEKIENINISTTSSNNDILVCITGKMDMTKKDLEDILATYNIQTSSTLTKKCNFLINAGEGTSSKCKKANEYGVVILDYWKEKSKILKGQLG